jgi:hypothetical protein
VSARSRERGVDLVVLDRKLDTSTAMSPLRCLDARDALAYLFIIS